MQRTIKVTNRLLISATTTVLAVALAACGSKTASGSGPPAAQGRTVSVITAGGIGSVLADASGRALYTPDQEADGTVHCVAACLSYWIPLAPGAGAPTSPAGGPTLGVITRPDGAKQVTTGGRPLYTFSLDSPGKVTGEGASDDFAGQHFKWHAVRSDGTTGAPGAPGATTPSTPATPATKPPSSPGYGY